MTLRVGHLETGIARIQAQLGEQALQIAEQSVRLDRVDTAGAYRKAAWPYRSVTWATF